MLNYPHKVSPLTPEALEKLHGRGDEVLFWQGKFNKENWSNCAFYHCRFEDVEFYQNLMQGISFFGTVFKNTSFAGSCLFGVMFNCGVIEDCDFSSCDLSGVNFFKTKIFNCDFRKSELEGVNFHSAQVISCDFSGVDLTDSNIYAADSLDGCIFNQLTKLPFNKQVALSKGMVYKPSHLKVVSDEVVPVEAQVIRLQDYQKPSIKNKEVGSPAQIINLVDYFNPKPTGDDGPKIA
jgi:hypothetical protein